MSGGPPRQKTFDPCAPDAPAEYRGARGRVETSIRGVYYSDYFPRLAAVADKCAVLRGLDSESGDHFESVRRLLLGTETNTLGIRWGERAASGGPPYLFVHAPSTFSPMDAVQVNLALAARWRRVGEQSGVSDWDAVCSYVGPKLRADPRLAERAQLLRAFDTATISGPAVERRDANQRLALELLVGGGGAFSRAFELPVKEVDRYGDNVTGKGAAALPPARRSGGGLLHALQRAGRGLGRPQRHVQSPRRARR